MTTERDRIMRLTPEERGTVASYDMYAREWVGQYSSPSYWEEERAALRELLPHGRILEIGVGGGRDAREFLEVGYEYVGVDISHGFLKEAKGKNPNAKLALESIYNLGFPDNSFDGFWCAATLLHIPKARIGKALQEIHRVVKPGGIGLVSVKKGKGERMKPDPHLSKTPMMFWAYYSANTFERILERNGFDVVDSNVRKVSERTTWLVFLVEVAKPKSS